MPTEIPIFLSTPGTISKEQEFVKTRLCTLLKEEDLLYRTVGDSDIANDVPLKEAAILARACYGGVILGFRQTHLRAGALRDGSEVSNIFFPTPWNHIEAGMLFALRRPLVVFVEDGLENRGIFERGTHGFYLHRLPSSDDFDAEVTRIKSVLKTWSSDVRHEYRRWS